MAIFQSTALGTSLMTTWINREFIKTLEAELQFQKFTNQTVIPQGMGPVGRFVTFGNAGGSTTALTEGSTAENEIGITTQSANITISEYGEQMPVSTLADYAGVTGIREALARRFAYGAALSIERQLRVAAYSITNSFFCNTSTLGGATVPAAAVGTLTGLGATALMNAAKLIRSSTAPAGLGALAVAARGFTGVPGHPDGQLAAILTPQGEVDMVTEGTTGRATWQNMVVNVAGSMGQAKTINGYMGSVYGTACYRAQNLTAGVVSVGSYTGGMSMVLAESAIAALSLQQMEPQIFINTPSEGDVGNPYRNRYTIAWHMFFGTTTSFDSWNRGVKIYSSGL